MDKNNDLRKELCPQCIKKNKSVRLKNGIALTPARNIVSVLKCPACGYSRYAWKVR